MLNTVARSSVCMAFPCWHDYTFTGYVEALADLVILYSFRVTLPKIVACPKLCHLHKYCFKGCWKKTT